MSDKLDNSKDILPALAFSPARIGVLAGNTFLQLVRMKVFYFLLVFAGIILVVAAGGFFFQPVQHLHYIKTTSFGVMGVFMLVFSIAATALLLPRDIEDRTLYTILSKPVPRFEYLLGRWLGVVMVNGVSMIVMFLVMVVVILFKMPSVEEQLVIEWQHQSQGEVPTGADLELIQKQVAEKGLTMSLSLGLVLLFTKAAVISAVSLFISTFASSSLFTIVISTMMVLIGHFHQLASDFWANAGVGGQMMANLLRIVFPNLAMFDVIDEVVVGQMLLAGDALKIVGMSTFYIVLYVLLAQLVFIDKEL